MSGRFSFVSYGSVSTSKSSSGDTTRRRGEAGEHRSGHGEQPGIEERLLKLSSTEQPFAEDRPDAEPTEDGDGEVARALGPALAR